jgi:hypothetical protein
MDSAPRDLIARERVLEAMREVGILLIAFAPLDFAVSGAPIGRSWPYLLVFLVVGLSLLSSSILIERRVKQWPDS